jgi:hypothetical protein
VKKEKNSWLFRPLFPVKWNRSQQNKKTKKKWKRSMGKRRMRGGQREKESEKDEQKRRTYTDKFWHYFIRISFRNNLYYYYYFYSAMFQILEEFVFISRIAVGTLTEVFYKSFLTAFSIDSISLTRSFTVESLRDKLTLASLSYWIYIPWTLNVS